MHLESVEKAMPGKPERCIRRAGKPFYAPGPYESPQSVRRRIEQLTSLLGEDGFGFDLATVT